MSDWKNDIEELKKQLSEGQINVQEFYQRKEDILAKASSEETFYSSQAQDDRTQAFSVEDEEDFHLQSVEDIFQTDFEHPRELGQYKIIEQIGAGGMGIIYRGRHKVEAFAKRTGDVAIKVMREQLSQNETFRNRFIAEASIGRSINHPNIVRIYDVLLDKGRLALVMDLVEGTALKNLIPMNGLPMQEALDIIKPLCEALDHLHSEGVVHRDLKPENILITPQGSPVVLDMGIAKDSEEAALGTSTGTSIGTPAYMAPEQIDAKRVTGAADRYAFGLVAYKMLTGTFPWKPSTSRGEIITSKFLGNLLPPQIDLPPEITAAIMNLLAPEPDDRFATCAEFWAALNIRPIVRTTNTATHLVYEPNSVEADLQTEDTVYAPDENNDSPEPVSAEPEPLIIDDQPQTQSISFQGTITVESHRSLPKLFRGWGKTTPTVEKKQHSTSLQLHKIPNGIYWMGANDGDPDERPRHQFTLSRAFFMSETLITQSMWEIVMGCNNSKIKAPNHPVEKVSWTECINFCNALSDRDGLQVAYQKQGKQVIWDRSANGYRLPTEAEWAAAARGQTDHVFSGSNNLSTVAWYSGNSNGQPQPVAQKRPNQFGLYDMTGNVWEWCWDFYAPKAYHLPNRRDPVGDTGEKRVMRGSAWNQIESLSRVSIRSRGKENDRFPTVGFRIARSL